jgi:hypothetical protein
MKTRKISRQEFVKYMAIGGSSFLFTPWMEKVFADQDLLQQARRAGFQDPSLDKGAITQWGRLKFRCDNNDTNWHVHPQGDLNLISKINGEVTTNIGESWQVADVAKIDELSKFPMLFMHAESPPFLTEDELKNLREYLMRGGFLYAEDCVNGYSSHGMGQGQWDFFFRRMRETLADLIPGAEFKRLPLDHPIFHSYYDLTQGQPHMQGFEHGGHGLTYKGRLVAYLSPSDAHCGWTNEVWFGRQQSMKAVQMGTNVYLYAMTHV